MSDHRYISFHLREEDTASVYSRSLAFPRWNSKKLDVDLFTAALEWIINSDPVENDAVSACELQKRLDRIMREALDLAAPRTRAKNTRQQVLVE